MISPLTVVLPVGAPPLGGAPLPGCGIALGGDQASGSSGPREEDVVRRGASDTDFLRASAC